MQRRHPWVASALGAGLIVQLFTGCSSGPEPIASPDAARASRRDAANDAAGDSGPAMSCESNDDCDDGVFCNGVETCTAGLCAPGIANCDDGIPCTVDACSVDMDVCTHRAPDMDGDGFGDASCVDRRGVPTGEDCDDTNADRAPGAVEVCDAMDVDEDCDLNTRGDRDTDGDGFEDAMCCNPTAIGSLVLNCGNDCDDGSGDVRPTAQEVCDGEDNNCNGVIDESCICTVGATRQCPSPGECAAGVQTCTDGRVWSDCSIAPLAETCNGLDDNCDGGVDEGQTISCYPDFDEDTFPDDDRPIEACPDESRVSVGRCPRATTNRAPGPGVTDCCDFDRRVFPGQTLYFTTVNGCGAFDFNCDGTETRRLTTTVSGISCSAASASQAACNVADSMVRASPGFWTIEVPACGSSSLWLARCQWLRGGIEAPSDTCFPTPDSRLQECR